MKRSKQSILKQRILYRKKRLYVLRESVTEAWKKYNKLDYKRISTVFVLNDLQEELKKIIREVSK